MRVEFCVRDRWGLIFKSSVGPHPPPLIPKFEARIGIVVASPKNNESAREQ